VAKKIDPSEPTLVFLHIPKTGGTSLHHHFADIFPEQAMCPERFSNLNQFSVDELRQWRFFSGHFNADEIKRIPGRIFLVTVLRDPIERLLSLYYFWKRQTNEFIDQNGLDYLRITKDGTLLDFLRSDHPVIVHATHNAMVTQLAGAVTTTPNGYDLMNSSETVDRISEGQLMSRALKNLLSFDVIGDISQLLLVYEKVASVFGMTTNPFMLKVNTREDVNEHLEPVTPEPITPEIRVLLEEKTRLDRILYQFSNNTRT
jgi:hypothetical protein